MIHFAVGVINISYHDADADHHVILFTVDLVPEGVVGAGYHLLAHRTMLLGLLVIIMVIAIIIMLIVIMIMIIVMVIMIIIVIVITMIICPP